MKNTPTNDSIEAGAGKTQIKSYGACQISIRSIHRRIKSNNSAGGGGRKRNNNGKINHYLGRAHTTSGTPPLPRGDMRRAREPRDAVGDEHVRVDGAGAVVWVGWLVGRWVGCREKVFGSPASSKESVIVNSLCVGYWVHSFCREICS